MIEIRPVSDLRNKFPEIEGVVNKGSPIYLTKNGYGAMVVMSLDLFSMITNDVEVKLDEADRAAQMSQERFSHEDVFGKVRRSIRV